MNRKSIRKPFFQYQFVDIRPEKKKTRGGPLLLRDKLDFKVSPE
jgi:hypothetical protein